MRDPYQVLGIDKGADEKAIKKAYRKLARDLHPDLHPGDRGAENRFKEVAAAYDFLSDPEKRARYDRGEIDPSGAPRAERRFYRTYAEGGPGARYHDPREFFRDASGMDFFSDLFGGRDQAGGARPRGRRGADVTAALEIDFLEAVNGGSRQLALAAGKQLRVNIPPGSEDGQVLRLKGQGMPGAGGSAAGDALITLKIRPHPTFTRHGSDIRADVPVTLAEAMLGARIEVPTVDGRVNITVPKGSNTGTRLRLRGKGAPQPGGGPRGDHYVTLKVVLPDKPDPELVRMVEEWSARHPYRVRGQS
jgi:DnaJ-class molecular chaperone